MNRMPRLLLAASPLLAAAAPHAPVPPVTPAAIIERAPAGDWQRIAADDLLVIDLEGGRRIVIALAPDFAPIHVANIRALARAGWFDGLAVDRVQDNYVAQWGDADGRKPLPAAIVAHPPAEYERAAAGLPLVSLPYRDTYAPTTGFVGPFPVAAADGRAWMTHCYGIVGVGRDMAPDTGTGAELYAVIGHAPRALDRNIALAGRVVAGMEQLAALPRGSGPLGFYADPARRVPITRARIAADLPAAERPVFAWLRPDSASFRAWMAVRANRDDDFFRHPAGAVDLCNALPPVRPEPQG